MPTPEQMACPICKLEPNWIKTLDYGERSRLQCPRCGTFLITGTAAAMAETMGLQPKLSAWIRERSEAGVEVPEINSKSIKEIEATLPDYRVGDKQLILLRALERRTKYPGDEVTVVPRMDCSLAWAAGPDEFRYHLRSLLERGLIRQTDGLPIDDPDFNSDPFTFEITPSGWTFLDEHARPSVISDQAFVAMSFATELKPAWENGIRDGVTRAGFRPYRVDASPHIERIDTKIMTEIKNSRFLIADVTLQRPGVYFEAGYALGLGLPVFWSVRKDDLPNVHFDTRQYNHIVWENEHDLAEQVFSFIIAVIGKGPAA